MDETGRTEKRERIRQIEDRKIEILFEIARINKKYDEQVSILNSEYEELHKELYFLQVEMIKL
jgi:hypothetical protein